VQPQNGPDLFEIMARMADRLEETRRRAESEVMHGSAGDGAVLVAMTLSGVLRRVTLDPDVVRPDGIERLQNLLTEALNDALDGTRREMEQRLADLEPDLDPPVPERR
jgi:DNA-binding protein YbaB